MTGKLSEAFRLLWSKSKNTGQIESDAVSSPPRPDTNGDSTRVSNESRKKSTSWFKRRNNATNKSNFPEPEESDEEDCHSYHYDNSVNLNQCSQIQIGARNEINYTIMYPTTVPADLPNFKDSFPTEEGSVWEDSQRSKPWPHKQNQSRKSRTSTTNSESSEEDANESDSHISQRIQAALSMLSEVVLEDDVLELKDHIGKGWKKVAAALGYSKGQIEQFKEKYQTIDETMYRLLIDWKRVNVEEASVSLLTGALIDAGEIDAAERLACLHSISPK